MNGNRFPQGRLLDEIRLAAVTGADRVRMQVRSVPGERSASAQGCELRRIRKTRGLNEH